FFRSRRVTETGRLRGYNLGHRLFPACAQPVKRSYGAAQHGQGCNTNCGPETHALCVTLVGINRLPARLPSYNVLSVRGNHPARFAGWPRTMSVSKRGPAVFPWPASYAAVAPCNWPTRSAAGWRPQTLGG